MNNYLLLPLLFLKFWYFDAPKNIIGYFFSLNQAFNEAFAFTLFIKTFFKPIKNEYREGLVNFSRAMGMIIKTGFIFVDLILFTLLLYFELMIILGFLLFPIATGALLFF